MKAIFHPRHPKERSCITNRSTQCHILGACRCNFPYRETVCVSFDTKLCAVMDSGSRWTWVSTVLSAIALDSLHGPGSVVGIATGYGLDGPGIEYRWGARFSAPVQTGPGPNPAPCTMRTRSFPGVKSGRGVTLTSHPLLLPWS